MPIHPQVSECLSLRINWRASVNLLIDQVSALVPTLFFVIVTLHLRRSLHLPFRHGHLFLQFYKTFTSQVSKARLPLCFYQEDTTHPNAPQHTPNSPMPLHPQVSVTQNQLESQCKSAHWSSLSSGANTFFRHCDTCVEVCTPPFRHGHQFLQLYKTFTSQVSKARLSI